MTKSINSKLDDISQLFTNRTDAEKLIEKLKTKLRKKPTDEGYISLFVLQVAYLESEIKHLLKLRKGVKLSDDAPFGSAIKKLQGISEKLNPNKINVYYYKYFLDKKYIEKFIKYNWKVNNLRINLYHNLFQSSLKTTPKQQNIKTIIKEIKTLTERYQIREYLLDQPDFYNDFKNKKFMNITNYRSLFGKNYSFPPSNRVTLELMINIALTYYGLELKFRI